MKNIYISLLLSITFIFGAVYDVGDIVSIEDQNMIKSTCYAGNGYDVGDSWKLLDWNGAENGGNYNVIYINMSATW